MADVKTKSPPPRRPAADEKAGARGGSGRLVRVVGIVGRVLVGIGLVLLFYTVYLLWGTSIETKQAQNELNQSLEAAPLVTQEQVIEGDIPAARPAAPKDLGEGLWTIKIPKIALNQVVVEGVGREELKKGPGRFPDCADVPAGTDCIEGSPYPGESGNVAISGHRTTFGAPFFKLNELEPGDVVDIESGPARYRYRVREQKIVDPSAREVVDGHGVDELTLTTCHPRFSAAQRLIVHADFEGASLIGGPPAGGPPAAAPEPAEQGEEELVPGAPPAIPTDVLVLVALAIAALLGAMALSERFRTAAVWSTLTIVGAAGLWIAVFPQVLRLMPANY